MRPKQLNHPLVVGCCTVIIYSTSAKPRMDFGFDSLLLFCGLEWNEMLGVTCGGNCLFAYFDSTLNFPKFTGTL